MQFALSEEQRSFATALDGMLAASDVPAVNRAWAAGDPAPGLALWERLCELGVAGLSVPEELGGIGGTPLDVAVAFETLGFHGVPGPWLEAVVLAPALLADTEHAALLGEVAEGTARVTFAAPPQAPFALDCDVSTHAFVATPDGVAMARIGESLASVDPSRHLHRVVASGPVQPLGPGVLDAALDAASLTSAAALLGAGERMLEQSVTYVTQRRQFGRVIGEYQAVKHALADVKVALDFARPLVHGAALALGDASPTAARDVSAAKVASARAAHLASRTALQVHGAIGYTLEYDLSTWILRTRALVGTWGTVADHRARVLDHLMKG